MVLTDYSKANLYTNRSKRCEYLETSDELWKLNTRIAISINPSISLGSMHLLGHEILSLS
jgi:hypothetical protein